MAPKEILKAYWGYDDFRPLQEDIINAVLEGRDVLALLPTGGGKSICFQVPALAKDGVCLVVSPLIALMKDQVENLKRRGINALAVYSGMSFFEVKKTLQNAAFGNYKFLYVSPERLETRLFLEYLPAINVNLLAIDEAHCVSQWGYDFRPPYLRIAALRELLPQVPVLALTASATKNVQDDICEKLLFGKNQQRFQQSFERPNLSYSVFNVASKQNKLLKILKNVPGTAIVYCKSRKHTQEIAELLRMNKINADHYHAGLSSEERTNKQESWIQNKTRVIVCTNAFGMGIDKPDVRVVVHYDVPDCLENYYQEAGRAGRDGRRAYAVLLYQNKDVNDLQQQSNTRFPSPDEIKKTYIALMNHLQVAAGSGEGVSYDLDIATFTAAFKLDVLQATYAIKALEQDDIVSFNEIVFKPATVQVIANRDDLTEFEKMQPQLEPLIKGLLRSYEGVFDLPVIIFESRLAKFLKQDIVAVKKGLQQLNDHGMIAYSPQKEKPQITLLKNRMYTDSYAINITAHLERKKNFEQRVKAMLEYTGDTLSCRSKFISGYFNAALEKPCGICDNCINQKELVITKEEFQTISIALLQLVKENKLHLNEIQQQLKIIKKEKLWKVISFLQAENKIATDKEGRLYC
ncbi:RecQ family ATP-dependent DNA helicase [Ferruginibacter sp.]